MYRRQTRLLNYLEPRSKYNEGKPFSVAKWRKEVLARDKNKCQNCFNAIIDPYRSRKSRNEAHHIIPRHHGGRNTLSNGISLCVFCHDYFDYMYFRYSKDYFEVIKSKGVEFRIEEVRRMMYVHYINYLLNIIQN